MKGHKKAQMTRHKCIFDLLSEVTGALWNSTQTDKEKEENNLRFLL